MASIIVSISLPEAACVRNVLKVNLSPFTKGIFPCVIATVTALRAMFPVIIE